MCLAHDPDRARSTQTPGTHCSRSSAKDEKAGKEVEDENERQPEMRFSCLVIALTRREESAERLFQNHSVR